MLSYSTQKKICIAVMLSVLAVCDALREEEIPQGFHPHWSYRAVVYEMNLRRQSVEGTFAAAEQQLERLSDLGADILCLMPVHPIGEKNRRGTLGSPYSVKDYRAVNAELGTMADFEHFLAAAHKEGFRVLIDWVGAYTSSDAVWTETNAREWYSHTPGGRMKFRDAGHDAVELDYRNPQMRVAMVEAMKFWVKKGVDGFRCCEVERVPREFWKHALAELRRVEKDLYFIADNEGNEFYECGFNATYALSLAELMDEVAQGRKTGADVSDYVLRQLRESPPTATHLTFTSHHGTLEHRGGDKRRWGDKVAMMAALTYMLPHCQPMIYTGQEVGYEGRVPLWEKDAVTDWTPTLETNRYRTLNHIKHEMEALSSGERAGEFACEWGARSEVLAFRLNTMFSKTFCAFNFSDRENYLVTSRHVDLWWNEGASGDRVSIESGEEMRLEPWSHVIYYTGYAP